MKFSSLKKNKTYFDLGKIGKTTFENIVITGEPAKTYLLAIKNTKISDFFSKYQPSNLTLRDDIFDNITAYIKIKLKVCDVGEIYLEKEQTYILITNIFYL